MFKIQLTKGRIFLWSLAVIYGIYISYVIQGRDSKTSYTDYKKILKFFDQTFEDIGDVPWYLIEQNCQKYHLKKHKSMLVLEMYEANSVIFGEGTVSNNKFLVTTLEKYTQFASEGLSPTVDEAFIPEILMKEVYEINKYAQVNTVWKNVSVDKKCYHLLEKISAVPPMENKMENPAYIRKHFGLDNE